MQQSGLTEIIKGELNIYNTQASDVCLVASTDPEHVLKSTRTQSWFDGGGSRTSEIFPLHVESWLFPLKLRKLSSLCRWHSSEAFL